MMKNSIKSLAFSSCLAFNLFSVDCLGLRQMSSSDSNTAPRSKSAPATHVRRSSNPVAGETQVVKNADIGGSMTAQNPEDDSSRSSSSSEEWIKAHSKLIDEAKNDESAFRELTDELQAENMVFVYDDIYRDCWHGEHKFGRCHNDSEFYGGIFERQLYDF